MQYVQLLRHLVPNPDSTGLPYVATVTFWDTIARTYYYTQQPTASNDPAELAVGAEVDRWTVNGFYRIVRYAGNGRVRTTREAGAPGTTGSNLAAPRVTPNPGNESTPGAADGLVWVYGELGLPPYDIAVYAQGNPTPVASAQVPSGQLPLLAKNLPAGSYRASITDSAGASTSTAFQVLPGSAGGRPTGTVLYETYSGDDQTGSGTRTIWNPTTRSIENYPYSGGGTDGYNYYTPVGTAVDEPYLLPGGYTVRQVYCDGAGGVYFTDIDTRGSGKLQLDNLILFNPDSVAEQNGGCLVEVFATALPVTFSLPGHPSNQTGSFDGLAAGEYTVRAVDAVGASLDVPFLLKAEYQPRWVLAISDVESAPLRVELWLRGYTGQPEPIFGQGQNPVVLHSDGLNTSLGGQGDLPAVVGTSAELALKVPAGLLEEVLVEDDRACRCDVYQGGRLQFRGYVTPAIYQAPLLGGLVSIQLTATDGLAGLKQDNMLGHVGQRLGGRRPLLHTLLHCLSRTGISLPVQNFVNRRSTEMSDDDAPELAATTERAGYWDESKGEPIDQRTVVDALCQLLGGTLVQREGTWQLRSPLEALAAAPGRAYRPAGTAVGALTAPAPTGFVAPLARPDTAWGWETANQQKQVRPGWKSLTASTDAGWLKNAFPAGEVFSDKYSWLTDGSQLKPLGGWLPGPAGFPLVLVQGGEKGGDYATQWPHTTSASTVVSTDPRYLDSPQLPLVPSPESCPAIVSVTGRLLPLTYFAATTTPVAGTAPTATLAYDILFDGQPSPFRGSALFKLGTTADKDTTATLDVPLIPAGTKAITLRLYPWASPPTGQLNQARVYDKGVATHSGELIKYDFGTGVYRLFVYYDNAIAGASPAPTGLPDDLNYQEIPATNESNGRLFVSAVGVELRPQNATWDSADNFRADGPGGTVRPTDVLEVYHPDVPIQAGLFEGNRYAFQKAVTLADGSLSTAWARAVDLQPSPVFEANTYDALALRSGNSRLLTGIIRCRHVLPPLLLDSVDTPYDVPGRRFLAGATAWNLKQCTTEVSLIEIGPGADAPDPYADAPDGVRITDQLYQYAPGKFAAVARGTDDGSLRVRD